VATGESGVNENHYVEHESTPHKYFTMMLNMADDDLDPYQYRLLAHYVRIAGNGGTKGEGLRETAKITRMSVNKLRAARAELVTMGYLRVVEPNEEQRKQGISATITVLDRWRENVNRYAKSYTPPVSDSTQGYEVSDTPPVSNLTHKNKNTPQEPVKERKKRIAPDVQSKALDEFNASIAKGKVAGRIKPAAKPAKAAKEYADVDPLARAAIIEGWLKNLDAPPVGAYARDDNHNEAARIHRAGYTAENVADYVKFAMSDPFWRGKTLTLRKVGELMPAWLKNRSAKPTAAQPRSPLDTGVTLNWPVEDAS
jgi:hypothetical protein